MIATSAVMFALIGICASASPGMSEYNTYGSGMEKIPPVPAGHPRVYVRPANLPAIQSSFPEIENPEFSQAWKAVRESDYMLCKVFVYLITGDDKAGQQAIKDWLTDFDKHEDNPDRVGRVFLNLMQVGACVYDWCYDLLTEEDKSHFIRRFEIAASSHSPGYPANPNGHAVVGHDTEGWLISGQLLIGAAIYDEATTMYDAAAVLFFRQFVPVRNFLYQSHMHHQGDSYFQTRFQHDQAVSWFFRRLGAGDVFTREQQFVPYQMVYNMRPDGQQMRSGDTFNHEGNDPRKRLIAMMTASYYNDPYLMTLADSPFFGSYRDYGRVFELLFRAPGAEKRPISELPRTKYFAAPMGEMVARTGWNMSVDSKDAVVHMRIGEYFFGNPLQQERQDAPNG